MTRYDDDAVIALLRDAVPPMPDAPDRVAAVRIRAGRQRVTFWAQGVGVAASVLLLVGVASAVVGGTEPKVVRPANDPIAAVADAFAGEESVRFRVATRPVGVIDTVFGMTGENVADLLTSNVTGAATRDGDLRVDGDAQMLGWGFEDFDEQLHLRVVDGVTYRSANGPGLAPKGKPWIREAEVSRPGVDAIERLLTATAAVAEDVDYLGEGKLNGVAVGEYRLTIPAKYAYGKAVTVLFALDADDRLRRVEATVSWGRLAYGLLGREYSGPEALSAVAMGTDGVPLSPQPALPSATPRRPEMRVRIVLELYGYGDDVDVTAPPASQVVMEDDARVSLPSGTDMCPKATAGPAEADRSCGPNDGTYTFDELFPSGTP